MALAFRKIQKIQPPGASVAIVNPRLRRPTDIFLGSTPRVSLLQNRTLTYNSASVGYSARGFFGAITTATTGSRASMTPANRLFPIPNQGTIAVEVLRITSTNTNAMLFGYSNGASDRVLFHAPYSDGNLYFDFGNTTTGSGGGRVSVAYTKKLNTVTRFVCIAGPTKGREVWVDGNLLVADSTATFSSTKATTLFSVGTASSADAGEANAYSLLVTSAVEWTSAEAVAWCNDPYGTTFVNPELSVPTYYPILSNLQAVRGNTSANLSTNVNY